MYKICGLIAIVCLCFGFTTTVSAEKYEADPNSWLQNSWAFEEVLEIPSDYLPPATAKNVKCHYSNFDLFFELFSEDAEFQQSFINYPLKVSYTYEDVDAPFSPDKGIQTTTKVKYVLRPNSGDIINRIFPNRHQRWYDLLLLDFDLYGPEMIVILRKEGAGVRLDYKFIYEAGCWYLNEVLFDSM